MKQYLSFVSKPARYLGNEVNSVRKGPGQGRLNFCLAFPDAYEVGMSHLGLQILYHILNEREEISCERVFAPWVDMENVLREKKIPLASLESNFARIQIFLSGGRSFTPLSIPEGGTVTPGE